MIRHVVMFTFRDGTTDEQIGEVLADLRSLPTIVPEVRAFHCGTDIGVNSGNFQVAVTADFADVAGYLAYRDNPEHQRMIREKGAPIIAQRTAVQFEF